MSKDTYKVSLSPNEMSILLSALLLASAEIDRQCAESVQNRDYMNADDSLAKKMRKLGKKLMTTYIPADRK